MQKKLLIFFTVLYLFPLAFYFWVVLPECLACNENTPEGLYVKDFWGDEVQCIGDNWEFNAYFNRLYLFGLGLFGLPLFIWWVYWFTTLKQETKQ